MFRKCRLLTLLFLVTGISSTASAQDSLSWRGLIDLCDRIPLYIDNDSARTYLPSLSDLRTEGGGSLDPRFGLFEAYSRFTLDSQACRSEFNYSYDELYAFSFMSGLPDSASGWKLVAELDSICTVRWGEARVISESELKEEPAADFSSGFLHVWKQSRDERYLLYSVTVTPEKALRIGLSVQNRRP
jgi:hypothetical protein